MAEVTAKWRQHVVLTVVSLALALGGGACAASERAKDVNWAQALDGQNGVVAVFNPDNCAVAGELVDALNALATQPGLTIALYAEGIGDSQEERTQTARTLGYERDVHVPAELPAALQHEARGGPLVIVIRDREVALIARGEVAKGAGAWLPSVLGISRRAREVP